MNRLPVILPYLVLLVLPLLTACSTASAPPPRVSDRALLRSSAPARPAVPNVTMQHDYVAQGDSLFLILKFEDSRQLLNVQRSVIRLEYTVRAGASERDVALLKDSVQVADTKTTGEYGSVYFWVNIPARLVASPNILQLRPVQKPGGQERITTQFRIPLHQEMLEKKIVVLQAASAKPLVRPYVTTDEPLVVEQYTVSNPVRVVFYKTDFMPALPPMSTRQEPSPDLLQPTDSVAYSSHDTIRLKQEGLYVFKNGTEHAVAVLAKPGAFPQVTQAKELLEPLIYLTTSEEREYLLRTQDPKATVDNFWLKIAGNNDVARGLIKTFYSRVEEANKIYTCHKAGWATDRGMIYIVYGPPSSISRVGNTETWIYRETTASPYVKFVFNKKENTFTQNYYELIRHRDYSETWYSTVARWRAGIAEI